MRWIAYIPTLISYHSFLPVLGLLHMHWLHLFRVETAASVVTQFKPHGTMGIRIFPRTETIRRNKTDCLILDSVQQQASGILYIYFFVFIY